MQDNTTREFSAWPTSTLEEHVLEQAAFNTQIPYNLYRYVAKILLQTYLEQLSLPTVSWFYKY
jgi:hypothetical protein